MAFNFMNKFKRKKDVPVQELPLGDLFLMAKKHDGEACFEIGRRYFEGAGVEQDYKSAIEFFEKAIKNSENAEAIYSLAICYEYGYGVAKNQNAAYHYYKMLHEKGIYQGTYELGRLTLLGIGCEPSERTAIELFKIAAKNDIPEAFYYIGVCCNDGIYVEQDYDKAYKYFKKAASMGYEEAQKMLNVYKESGYKEPQ